MSGAIKPIMGEFLPDSREIGVEIDAEIEEGREEKEVPENV